MKYIRRIILTTVAGEFTDLKISFSVEKTVTGTPNEAEIKIWNLSDASRASINEELASITLEAGYEGEGNVGLIFSGQTRDITHDRQGVDIVTTIQAGDGDLSSRKSYVSRTYDEGTTIEYIVRDIQTLMDAVELGELKFPPGLASINRPFSFMTTPKRALDELGRSYGFHWSVQNGALEVIPGNDSLSEVTDITPETGMIGVPSITDAGVVVKCLLDPDIRPNRKINIQSETTDREGRSGEYRVSSVAYAGDNWDGQFYCEVEAELINDGKAVVT